MENDELPEFQVGNAKLGVRLKCRRASVLLPLCVVELLIEMYFQKNSDGLKSLSTDINLASPDIDSIKRGE